MFLIGTLAVVTLAFAFSVASTLGGSFLLPAWAHDGEEDGGSSGSGSGDDSSGDNSGSSNESDQKQAERERERLKKQNEQNRERLKQLAERSGRGDDALETEDENGDDNGMFKDRTKTLEKLNERLTRAKEDILKRAAERGIDATAALARLDEAQAKIAAVGDAFDEEDFEGAKDLAKEARKIAHFADKDLKEAEDLAKGQSKVDKRLNQVKNKLARLKALGGDTTTFESQVAEAEALLTKAKGEITGGSDSVKQGVIDLHAAERQLKRIKDGIENAIFALRGTDDEFGRDHEDEAHDIAEHLNDVADIEGDDDSVGSKARSVAKAEDEAGKKVADLVEKVQNRSALAELLIGADERSLGDIQNEIAAKRTRADALEAALSQVTDPDVKALLAEQVKALRGEAENLESFIDTKAGQDGLFGWLKAFVPSFQS